MAGKLHKITDRVGFVGVDGHMCVQQGALERDEINRSACPVKQD